MNIILKIKEIFNSNNTKKKINVVGCCISILICSIIFIFCTFTFLFNHSINLIVPIFVGFVDCWLILGLIAILNSKPEETDEIKINISDINFEINLGNKDENDSKNSPYSPYVYNIPHNPLMHTIIVALISCGILCFHIYYFKLDFPNSGFDIDNILLYCKNNIESVLCSLFLIILLAGVFYSIDYWNNPKLNRTPQEELKKHSKELEFLQNIVKNVSELKEDFKKITKD